jgi:hypothetical protein
VLGKSYRRHPDCNIGIGDFSSLPVPFGGEWKSHKTCIESLTVQAIPQLFGLILYFGMAVFAVGGGEGDLGIGYRLYLWYLINFF